MEGGLTRDKCAPTAVSRAVRRVLACLQRGGGARHAGSGTTLALLAVLLGPDAGAMAAAVNGAEQRFAPLRGPYREAVEAARKRDVDRFERLYAGLADYPLAPYLDYERLLVDRYRTAGTDARQFVAANADSPLGVRFLDHYLRSAGANRRWDDFLAAVDREPRSERLRCYFFRAQLANGQPAEAWRGARQLWRSGRSVDDACDPLFSAWRAAGQLTGEAVWERALLAFEARQFGLLRYVSSLGGPALQADLEVLQRVYREPHRVRQLVASASADRRPEILTQGLVRLSRYDPARSLQNWQGLERAQFSADQVARLESAIALRGLIEREPDLRAWIDASLGRWQDDRLTETRLRWAIEELDWSGLLALSQHLGPDASAQSIWRYWRARALEELGQREAADALYRGAAAERSYYGFLSADRIGAPYSFNEEPLPSAAGDASLPPLATRTALRVNELQALDELRDAHAEWSHALPRLDRGAQRQLGLLAANEGWYRLAIDAANESRSWDLLSLRFPLAYTEVFRSPASLQSLPLSELMAIARRESAFFPAARSAVGARGLMQLLPSTGRGLARRQGMQLAVRDLYDVERNVALGSAYYRQLLERFDGNRAVALAAYNAGPNRVQHWVGKGLPLDAWIETIPYRETREYVKAVLAYSVVFDHRLGEEAQLLSAAERHAAY